MASKRRLRRRSCAHKKRFGSQEDAVAEVRRRVAKTGGKLGGALATYHCQFCSGYHIGHPPAAVRANIGNLN